MKVFLAALLAVVAGSFLTALIWIMVLVGIAGSMESGVGVEENSILKIDMAENITDSPSVNPFSGLSFPSLEMTKSLSLYQVLQALDAAREDDRIKGIYLRMSGMGTASLAVVEEMRSAIEEFRQSGKFVVAYDETYSQSRYYLASAADRIYLQDGYVLHDSLLQGAVRQDGRAVRDFPSDGLQIQECCGALFPDEDVRCQPRADDRNGELHVEYDGRNGG